MTKESKQILKELIDIMDGLTKSWNETNEHSKQLQKFASEMRSANSDEARKEIKKRFKEFDSQPRVYDATDYWKRLHKIYQSPSIEELRRESII